MADTPTAPMQRTYTIQTRQFTSWIDPNTGAAVEGYQITALWNATQQLLTVRVPTTSYTAANVDAAIRAAGAQDEAIANLGA